MSLPSYELFESHGAWVCTGALPSGKPYRFEAGRGCTRDQAVWAAEEKIRGKIRSSNGSRKRWEKARAAKVSASTPPSPPAAESAGPGPDLRAKLLGLGDRPIAPDQVIPPAADGNPAAKEALPDEERDDLDDEGSEMIASLLAKGLTVGLVAAVNYRLKKRKPPQTAEPHEKGLEWFHDGMEIQLRKLLGKTATLGPTGKIFAGAAIIVQQSAPPSPPPAAPTEHTNGVNHEPSRSLLQLGVFGVEGTRSN